MHTDLPLEKGANLRIMTYNIRHGRGLGQRVNLNRTLAELATAKADIIGLQEVDRFSMRSGYKDQIKQLATALDMYWYFAPSLSSGWRQYGNGLLSKYPIEVGETIRLPSRFEQRTALQAVIKMKQQAINIINTHLGVSLYERKLQMPALLRILQKATLPTIMMGDFNMETDHELMTELKGKLHKICTGQPTFYKGSELDHLFVSSQFQPLKAWTQPSTASDHYPLIAELYCRMRREYGKLAIARNGEGLSDDANGGRKISFAQTDGANESIHP